MRPFLELSADDLRPGIDVPFWGAFHFSQKVLPLMLKGENPGGFLGFTGATAALKGEFQSASSVLSRTSDREQSK